MITISKGLPLIKDIMVKKKKTWGVLCFDRDL